MNWTMRCCKLIVCAGLSWPLLACDPLELSDAGQYQLDIGLVDQLGLDGRRVLVGTEFSTRVSELAGEGSVDPKGGGLLCAASSASGSLTAIDDHVFWVEAAGPGAVEFAAPSEACPANQDSLAELGPDRWSMIGVEASAATGVWMANHDQLALSWNTNAGPRRLFPTSFGRPLHDLRVVAGGTFAALPAIIDASAGERVEIRWNLDDLTLNVPAHFHRLSTAPARDGDPLERDYLFGSLRPGESFDSSITILDHEFAMPKVTAIPVEHVVSLELIPVYGETNGPERDWGGPLGVATITRDAEGRRVLGAPIEWSVSRGRLTVATEVPDALYTSDCKRAPKRAEWRSATVEASLGDIVASADFDWIALPGDHTDPSDPNCSGSACDCSTTGSPGGSALALLALLGLGPWLRRHALANDLSPRVDPSGANPSKSMGEASSRPRGRVA